MLFKVGDLVKRTVKPYDYWLGVIVKIERITHKAVKFPACKNQTYDTIWVKWTTPAKLAREEPESYWAEDLTVVSKAK